jgi:hypothetical protein
MIDGIHLSVDHLAIVSKYPRQIPDDNLRDIFFRKCADFLRPTCAASLTIATFTAPPPTHPGIRTAAE